MIQGAALWSGALVASGIAHGIAGWALLWSIEPEPVPTQPPPDTQLQLAAYPVERSEAQRAEPETQNLAPSRAEGASLSEGVTTLSRAEPVQPGGERMAATAPSGTRLDKVQTTGSDLPAVAPPANRAEAQAPETTITSAAALDMQPASGKLIASPKTTAQVLASTQIVESATPLSATEPIEPTGDKMATVAIAANSTSAIEAAPNQARPLEPVLAAATQPGLPSTSANVPEPQSSVAVSVAPPALSTTASLAFGKEGPIDPVSLAAFQSFMQPGQIDAAADGVRDGISGLLSAVPCARLQVLFDPADNTLALSGHIPEDGLRETVLASMQSQMGADIPVRDNLLILPRPQCGALSGIADVGLPESTDQITNPLLLGENTHARSFRYTAGQPLVLTLQGADYDAFFYVDYFDAAGNVIHLAPNQFTPLEIVPAKAEIPIGSPKPLQPGQPGLYIEVAPPFGQEIAVAFVASHPLSEETRPLIEPADAYLGWLKEQVSAARGRHPDFKGEWVYFFVSTAAN